MEKLYFIDLVGVNAIYLGSSVNKMASLNIKSGYNDQRRIGMYEKIWSFSKIFQNI